MNDSSAPRHDPFQDAHQRYLDSIRAQLAAVEPSATREGLALVFHVLLGLTVVLAPLALVLGIRRGRHRTQVRLVLERLDTAEEFAERAKVVLAYPLMVNSMLRSPGEAPATALVIISFDPYVAHDTMMRLAADLSAGGSPASNDNDRAFADALMSDEDFKAFRRRKIPASITGGPEVYACDLAVHPLLLRGRHVLDDWPFVPCAAEPGDSGRIAQIPFWVFEGCEPPASNLPEAEAAKIGLFLIHQLEELRARGG